MLTSFWIRYPEKIPSKDSSFSNRWAKIIHFGELRVTTPAQCESCLQRVRLQRVQLQRATVPGPGYNEYIDAIETPRCNQAFLTLMSVRRYSFLRENLFVYPGARCNRTRYKRCLGYITVYLRQAKARAMSISDGFLENSIYCSCCDTKINFYVGFFTADNVHLRVHEQKPTKHQRQCRVNAAMMLAIQLSLESMQTFKR